MVWGIISDESIINKSGKLTWTWYWGMHREQANTEQANILWIQGLRWDNNILLIQDYLLKIKHILWEKRFYSDGNYLDVWDSDSLKPGSQPTVRGVRFVLFLKTTAAAFFWKRTEDVGHVRVETIARSQHSSACTKSSTSCLCAPKSIRRSCSPCGSHTHHVPTDHTI